MAVKHLPDIKGIKGFIPLSMLDWEGRLVTTIFLGGCNFRCPFCHNSSLVLQKDELPDVSIKQLEELLRSKEGWVDGVCITGGEPTIDKGLPGIARFVKELGMQVKLDTNGTMPNTLKALIDEGLIDAVAMDIKTSFDKYEDATRQTNLSDKVKESITLLVNAATEGRIELEFRTTAVPAFVSKDDVFCIAKYLKSAGAKRYYLQQFNPKTVMEPEMREVKPYSKDFLTEVAQEATKILPTYIR